MIQKLRKSLGYTQEEMAAALNVSLDAVSSWEQGRRKPGGPAEKLIQVAIKLNKNGYFEEYFIK